MTTADKRADRWWRAAALLAVGLGAWGLKRHYAQSSTDGLLFILAPTERLVALASGTRFEYETGIGYLNRDSFFAIAKPCAGVNFMLAAWLMLGFVLAARARDGVSTAKAFGTSLALSYLASIVVNAARILLALELAAHPFVSDFWTAGRVHRVEGIVVYFAGLAILHAVVSSGTAVKWMRSAVLPLVFYYAVVLGIPLVRGTHFDSGRPSEHALFVLSVPPLLLLAIAAVRALPTATCRAAALVRRRRSAQSSHLALH
jgi:exosortase K